MSPAKRSLAEAAESDTPLYSLRLIHEGGPSCAGGCGQPTAQGIVGFQEEAPLCDACFLLRCPGLGIVLYLVNMARWFRPTLSQAEGGRKALSTFLAFLDVFDLTLKKQGCEARPPHPLPVSEGAADPPADPNRAPPKEHS